MNSKSTFFTTAVVLLLLGGLVWQELRVQGLQRQLAGLATPTSANAQRKVDGKDQARPSAADGNASGNGGKLATDTAPNSGSIPEIVARVQVSGPGEAVFAKRGSAIVLESFTHATQPTVTDLGFDTFSGGGTLSFSSPQNGKPNWDHAQATGAPDTMQHGDRPTAWAPRTPRSGLQWLQLGYDKAVPIREINIHETYNKGAISKVTAMMPNGSEQVLWTGNVASDPNSTTGPQEIQETSVPVPAGISSKQIRLYVDTNRVGSWPEIDAVEMVGRDGSRQWASSSSASSSYSDIYRSPDIIVPGASGVDDASGDMSERKLGR